MAAPRSALSFFYHSATDAAAGPPTRRCSSKRRLSRKMFNIDSLQLKMALNLDKRPLRCCLAHKEPVRCFDFLNVHRLSGRPQRRFLSMKWFTTLVRKKNQQPQEMPSLPLVLHTISFWALYSCSDCDFRSLFFFFCLLAPDHNYLLLPSGGKGAAAFAAVSSQTKLQASAQLVII